MDDKAVIPNSISVRAHNPSLGLSDSNTVIAALHHDWKIVGIVPSVSLIAETSESSQETFFIGQTVVSSKIVFQKSCSLRHGTKLTAKIKTRVDDFLESVLLLFTNGGGDHNKTHASVQKSLIATFINLDLEFFCTKWSCPTKS